jgi:hypothetical protein
VIYGRRIREDSGDIRIEEDNICALAIALVVLATDGCAEVILREQVVVGLSLASLTHTFFFRAGSTGERS